jgi:hypothetical protein
MDYLKTKEQRSVGFTWDAWESHNIVVADVKIRCLFGKFVQH